jgi:signal transduction histidine kinase
MTPPKTTDMVSESTSRESVPGRSDDLAFALVGLVGASRDPASASVNCMLDFVRGSFGAYGCALWQTSPSTNETLQWSDGELFVLAESFPEGVRFAMHDLPIRGSWTGEIVSGNKAKEIRDVSADPVRSRNHLFVRGNNIGPMIAAPVQYGGTAKGALNVYRQKDQEPFDEEQLRKLQYMADIIPHLYEAGREGAGFQLLRDVEEIIREAEKQSLLSLQQMQSYLQQICAEVGKTFHALETSVFLAFPSDASEFSLQATTWDECVDRRSYVPKTEGSVTEWILGNQKPVRLLHLPAYVAGSTKRSDLYPGLAWNKSERFLEMVRELVGGSPEQQPPITFMGVPIVSGEKTLGVIRTCAAKKSPYFFSEADLQLLTLVAAQAAQLWDSWLSRTKLHEDGEAWQNVVNETNQLNSLVQSHLTGHRLDEKRWLKSALKAFAKNVAGAEGFAVRLYDKEANELFFETTYGNTWQRGNEKQRQDRLKARFPIGSKAAEAKSVGEHVFRTRAVYVAEDLAADPHFKTARRLFSHIKREVCAPILLGEEVEGVLDIQFEDSAKIPRHVESFAKLMGKQLGLYLSLSRSMSQLRDADSESRRLVGDLQNVQEQQKRTFEDLYHQLKGPLRIAKRRADVMLRDANGKLLVERSELQAVRGLLRKAQRVANSLHLLAELERTPRVVAKPERLEEHTLVQMLIEAADDASQEVKDKGVYFHVDADSFARLRTQKVMADGDLVEQAVNNLYDNAAKYSFENSHVYIKAGITGSGRFQIAVTNTGLRIRAHEIKECVCRGWRSDDVMNVVGDGSGIGLWIVNHIMLAHDGELVVVPTDDDDETTVKLVFPIAR